MTDARIGVFFPRGPRDRAGRLFLRSGRALCSSAPLCIQMASTASTCPALQPSNRLAHPTREPPGLLLPTVAPHSRGGDCARSGGISRLAASRPRLNAVVVGGERWLFGVSRLRRSLGGERHDFGRLPTAPSTRRDARPMPGAAARAPEPSLVATSSGREGPGVRARGRARTGCARSGSVSRARLCSEARCGALRGRRRVGLALAALPRRLACAWGRVRTSSHPFGSPAL